MVNKMESHALTQYPLRTMPRGSQRLKTVSFRIDPQLAEELKQFLAQHASRPSYLTPHAFASEAIHRELERLTTLYEDNDGKSTVTRRINAVQLSDPHRT